jgi:hypothetical protein
MSGFSALMGIQRQPHPFVRGRFIEQKTFSKQYNVLGLSSIGIKSRELCLFSKSLQFGKIWGKFTSCFVLTKILISCFTTSIKIY